MSPPTTSLQPIAGRAVAAGPPRPQPRCGLRVPGRRRGTRSRGLLLWHRGSRVLLSDCGSAQRRRRPQPRASTMDFEDGKRRLRPAGVVGTRRWPAPGVCAPSQNGRVGFVLWAPRPPGRRGPRARSRLPGFPARPGSVRRAPGRSVRAQVPGRARPELEGLRAPALHSAGPCAGRFPDASGVPARAGGEGSPARRASASGARPRSTVRFILSSE